jgi:hypothetical protein
MELSQTPIGEVGGGDGVVPRGSATPHELDGEGREMYAAEAHASLQNFDAVLTQVRGVLTRGDLIAFERLEAVAEKVTLGLAMQDVYGAGPVEISAKPSKTVPLEAQIFEASTRKLVARAPLRASADGQARAAITLPAGAYRITVGGGDGVSPVTDAFLVVDAA